MSIKLQQDNPIDLMSPILLGSAQTLIVTKEGLSVSVSTTLLRMFSKTLPSILNLHPCTSTSIIIPDCSLFTLSILIEILTKGYSKQCTDESSDVIHDIIEVAGLIGIDVNTLDFGKKSKENVLKQSKQTRKTVEDKILGNSSRDSSRTVRNIKVEDQDTGSAFQCTLCNKTFKSPAPLGYHYCKHFGKDLHSLDFSDLVQDEKCVKCNRTFFDRNAMLSHIGVKHGFINDILEAKGLPQLQLEEEVSAVNIKTESEEHVERSCEICVEDFSRVPVSSLAYHYCEHFSDKMGTFFARFYMDKICKICRKNFNTVDSLMVHIGVRHGKINAILNAEQLKPLRFPKKKRLLTSSTNPTEPTIFANEKILNALREPKLETESKNISESQLEISRQKFEAKVCFICDKSSSLLANLRQHISTHFWEELKTVCSDLIINGRTCGICNETSPNATVLVKHISITHGKLDEILESKGYPTLSKRKHSRKSTSEPKAPRRSSTADLKEIRECEICSKEFESVSKLGQHMVTGHFLKEIREDYQNLYNGAECLLCNKPYNKNTFVMHIGATHDKLDEVLVKKGYRPLKAKIVPNFRKIQIKKERPDSDATTEAYLNSEESSNNGDSNLEEMTHVDSNLEESVEEPHSTDNDDHSQSEDNLGSVNPSEDLTESNIVDSYTMKYI